MGHTHHRVGTPNGESRSQWLQRKGNLCYLPIISSLFFVFSSVNVLLLYWWTSMSLSRPDVDRDIDVHQDNRKSFTVLWSHWLRDSPFGVPTRWEVWHHGCVFAIEENELARLLWMQGVFIPSITLVCEG